MNLFLKNLIFTIIVPGTVAGFLPYYLFRPYAFEQSGMMALLTGSGVILAGTVLYLACVFPFATLGKGTPAPIDAPVNLVISGPYKIVRNPMYVAVLLVIFGQAILLYSQVHLFYGLVVATAFACVVYLYEEPALRAKFGNQYIKYCKRVPRWIPSVLRPQK